MYTHPIFLCNFLFVGLFVGTFMDDLHQEDYVDLRRDSDFNEADGNKDGNDCTDGNMDFNDGTDVNDGNKDDADERLKK